MKVHNGLCGIGNRREWVSDINKVTCHRCLTIAVSHCTQCLKEAEVYLEWYKEHEVRLAITVKRRDAVFARNGGPVSLVRGGSPDKERAGASSMQEDKS